MPIFRLFFLPLSIHFLFKFPLCMLQGSFSGDSHEQEAPLVPTYPSQENISLPRVHEFAYLSEVLQSQIPHCHPYSQLNPQLHTLLNQLTEQLISKYSFSNHILRNSAPQLKNIRPEHRECANQRPCMHARLFGHS